MPRVSKTPVRSEITRQAVSDAIMIDALLTVQK
jgi:hypothetical protein